MASGVPKLSATPQMPSNMPPSSIDLNVRLGKLVGFIQ